MTKKIKYRQQKHQHFTREIPLIEHNGGATLFFSASWLIGPEFSLHPVYPYDLQIHSHTKSYTHAQLTLKTMSLRERLSIDFWKWSGIVFSFLRQMSAKFQPISCIVHLQNFTDQKINTKLRLTNKWSRGCSNESINNSTMSFAMLTGNIHCVIVYRVNRIRRWSAPWSYQSWWTVRLAAIIIIVVVTAIHRNPKYIKL